MRQLLTLMLLVVASTVSAQSVGSAAGSACNRDIASRRSFAPSGRYSPYRPRRVVTGDFRNYFQERIDRISQPQIQYIRPGYISTRHPNHGANVRYPSRSNWRRETYLARKRQSATDLVSTR